MDATPPLTGIRVLDLASELTAYGTRLLAGLGADVLVVEPPGGHPLRRRPPLPTRVPAPYGLPFAYLFAGKRAVTLDVTAPAALPLLTGLARAAGVVIAEPAPPTPRPRTPPPPPPTPFFLYPYLANPTFLFVWWARCCL